jgi:hypothetical protein
LEGSNDASAWIELDQKRDHVTMDMKHSVGTFAVACAADSRFVRLRQTGKNAAGNNYIAIAKLELFGILCDGSRNLDKS